MSVQTEEEKQALLRAGELVARTIEEMKKRALPGVTTAELDRLGRFYFESRGGVSAPEKDYRFPGATCISVNHEVAHGIPGSYRLREGDLVNIDVSLSLNGFYADAGVSFCVNNTNRMLVDLCDSSREILNETIRSVRPGMKLNEIGRAIESRAREKNYTVIYNLAGHGTGRKLHEEPLSILNYYDRKDRRRVGKNQVLAVETFISTGANLVHEESDGWTLSTRDGSYVAQFEHTFIATDAGPILTTV